MAIDVAFVRTMIPPAMPGEIAFNIAKSLSYLEQMESREQGDPRQIQATIYSLMATIEVYRLVAETARGVR
jgi:hypothetical protein